MHDPAELMGRAQKARGERDLDLACQLYAAAAGVYLSLGERLSYAHALRHLADVYQNEKDYERARAVYEEALENYRGNLGTKVLDLANTVRPYALLMEALGEPEKAKELWAEARTLYAAVRVEAGVKECEEHLRQL